MRTFAYVLPLYLSSSSLTMSVNDEWRLEVCLVPTECIMQRGSTEHTPHLLCHVTGRSALGGNRDHWDSLSGMLYLPRFFNNMLFRGRLASWIPLWENLDLEHPLRVPCCGFVSTLASMSSHFIVTQRAFLKCRIYSTMAFTRQFQTIFFFCVVLMRMHHTPQSAVREC